MGDVLRFGDSDGDLEKPKWFYAMCERLTHEVYDHFRDTIESCPFGDITFDHIWFEMAETPVRLMALVTDDHEGEGFIASNALYRAIIGRMGERGVADTIESIN